MSQLHELEINYLDDGREALATPLVAHKEAARRAYAIDNGYGEEPSGPGDYSTPSNFAPLEKVEEVSEPLT